MDIITEIDKFINSRIYHYALLVNGKWGTGKTFFIKNNLINHIKDSSDKDVNYISLYGIRNTETISEMLCIQSIRDKTPDMAKRWLDSKGGQILTKLSSVAVKCGMDKLGASDEDAGSILGLLPNYDNNVVIFDDLERCGCDINEVLGYINDFVEHSDAAVIIVANEEEIGKYQLDTNIELQKLIAADPNITVELPETLEDFVRSVTGAYGTKELAEKKSFTVDEIEFRRKAIFNNNDRYRRMKEKVIGLTINYEPDLPVIFRSLIEEKTKINTKLKDVLLDKEMIDWFVTTATRDEHKNLRTFQYFLEKIIRIFEIIQNGYPELHKGIVKYTFRSCIKYMKGLPMPSWTADYGSQSFEKRAIFDADQEFGFRFIDDLIVKNEADSEYINDVLTRYRHILKKKGQLENDPYNYISGWWEAEDSQVEKWLDAIEENIRTGVYSTELYTGLMKCIAILKCHGVMTNKCDSIFDAMKKYILSANPQTLEDLEMESFFLENAEKEIYSAMREEVKELLDKAMGNSEQQKYEEAIAHKSKWASGLMAITEEILRAGRRSFVYCLDTDKLMKCIDNSSNYELSVFRHVLRTVYDDRIYWDRTKDDVIKLKALHDRLKNCDTSEWGDIKKNYQKWIIGDIDKYLARL